MRKLQVPNPKPQRGSQRQAGRLPPRGARCLELGAWSLGFVRLLGALVLLSAGQLGGQPVAVPPLPSANRYLLIVDTSRPMSARSHNMLKTVQDLLKSDLGGQMKPGDTLGVWTYNADLYAGRFSLQRWSPNDQKAVTARVLAFLKGQKYEKSADLGKVLAALERVVKDSRLITVILVSAGDGFIHGTPFDDRINEFCQRWHGKQQAARMPFVIVLRGRNGELTDYTLNRPPWPVQMPYLPVEPLIASPSKSPEAPRPVQPPTAPPLIVSGKKPKALQAPKSEEETPAKPERPVSVAPSGNGAKEEPAAKSGLAGTLALPVEAGTKEVTAAAAKPAEPARVEQPKPAAPAVEATKALPVAAAPVKPAAEPTPAQAPAPVQAPPPVPPAVPAAVPAPKVESVKTPEPKPVPVAAAAILPAAPVPPPAAKAEVVKAPEPKPAGGQLAQAAALATPSPPPKPAPEVAAPPKPPPAPAPQVKAEAAPVPPAPPAIALATNGAVPAAQVATVLPASTVRPPAAVAPPPARNPVAVAATAAAAPEKRAEPAALPVLAREVSAAPSASLPANAQAAAAVPPGTFISHKTAWLAGLVLAAAAFGFGLLALRRSRATPHASLITRSLDREKRL